MEIRSKARTENSHKNEKKYFVILQEFAKMQMMELESVKNEFLKEELKNICHYIKSKMDVLLLNIELQYIIINRLQQISQNSAQDMITDHFNQLNTIQLNPDLVFQSYLNQDCTFLRICLKNPLGKSRIKRDKKLQTFSYSNVTIKYEELTDDQLARRYEFVQVSKILDNYNLIYDVKQKNVNYQLQFTNLIPSNTSEIESYMLQVSLLTDQRTSPNEAYQYLLPIRHICRYENSFFEQYYVQLRDQEDYTLMMVINELAQKQLKYSEHEIAHILIDILEAIRYFHLLGYILTSFSPHEIVYHESRWKFKSINFIQKSQKLLQVNGYFEFMSPQLQYLIKMNQPNGSYFGFASDYYNLGSLINGMCYKDQKYSPAFNKIIQLLTDFDSLQRTDFSTIEKLLLPFRQSKKQGLDISKSKIFKPNPKKLYQSFVSLGSKTLALSSVHPAYPNQDYHSLIEKAYLLQIFQDYADAITYYRKAEQNAIQSNKPYNIIPINNNIGQILQKTGKFQQALEPFQKAVQASIQVRTKNSLEYVKSLENLSTLFSDLEKYQDAEKGFEEVLNIKKKLIQNQNDMQFSITYNNIAIVQEKLNKKQQAIANFKKGLEIIQFNLGQNNPQLAVIHERVGDLFFSLAGRQEDALNHFNSSLNIYNQNKDGVQIHKLSEKIKRIPPIGSQKISQK